MSRNGEVSVLVGLSAGLIVLLILFLGVFPAFKSTIERSGEKGQCEWSVLLAALKTTGTLGIVGGIPEGCKARRVTLTEEEVNKKLAFARARLKQIQTDPAYAGTAPYFGSPPPGQETQREYEFAVDALIADEMVDCWEKVFKGKLPLFYAQAFDVGAPPVNCVVCAHIRFEPSVLGKVSKPSITSLREWMANNKVPRTSQSYLEFLQEGQTKPLGLAYPFIMDSQGVAVLYKHIALPAVGIRTGDIRDEPQEVRSLMLVPYTQDAITGGEQGCTLVVD